MIWFSRNKIVLDKVVIRNLHNVRMIYVLIHEITKIPLKFGFECYISILLSKFCFQNLRLLDREKKMDSDFSRTLWFSNISFQLYYFSTNSKMKHSNIIPFILQFATSISSKYITSYPTCISSHNSPYINQVHFSFAIILFARLFR